MRHAGQSVTRTMLLEKVWEYHFDPQTNDHRRASRLRSKIDKGFDRPMLQTVRGAGYRLDALVAMAGPVRLPRIFRTTPFRLTLFLASSFVFAASALFVYILRRHRRRGAAAHGPGDHPRDGLAGEDLRPRWRRCGEPGRDRTRPASGRFFTS